MEGIHPIGSSEGDRTALIALYMATDGENWGTAWDIPGDISTWYGVTVNREGRVVALRLNNNNLRGSIPPELGDLGELQELRLQGNQLSGTIPKELGALSELVSLDLGYNKLTGLWDDARLCGEERAPDAMATSAGDGMPEQLKAWLDWLDRLYLRGLNGNAWTQPPAAVVGAGISDVREYFSDLYAGNVVIHHSLKVVIVGRSGAGKTSLRQSLIFRQARPTRSPEESPEESTVLVDVEEMKIDDFSVRIFDCAGQVAYYGLLQLFITSRALYLLACDLGTLETSSDADNDGRALVDAGKLDELGVGAWLRALTFRLGKADVILVGTQCDRIAAHAVRKAERLLAACANWAQEWRDPRGEGWIGSPTLIDDTMSLTSCSADDGKQETKTETEWPCDWGTVPETNPPLSLLRRLTHDREGNSRAVEMVLPRSWALAMEILECLAHGRDPVETAFEFYSIETEKREALPGGSSPRPGYKVMLRDELQKKWQDVINALKLKNILVHNPKGALEGALTIRQHEGTVLRHGSLVFLDVAWLTLILKPLLTHKREEHSDDIYLPDVGIWLKDEQHKISWERFCDDGVLEPQLAEALWPDDNMAEYVLKIIDAIGLTFPLPGDARHGVVMLLRLPNERPSTVGTALEEFRENESAFFVVRWKFHQGVPPGAIENVITRCCGFGTPSSFWRFGVLVRGEVEEESYAFVLEYLDGNLLLEVFGETGNAMSWAALSYTLSVVQNMFVDFPGLPRTVSWDCLEHQAPQQNIKMSQQATHVGGHLLSGVCPICDPEAGTLGAIAVKLVRMVDVKQSRDDLFNVMQNLFKELPAAWRWKYSLKDFPNEEFTTPVNEDAAAQEPSERNARRGLFRRSRDSGGAEGKRGAAGRGSRVSKPADDNPFNVSIATREYTVDSGGLKAGNICNLGIDVEFPPNCFSHSRQHTVELQTSFMDMSTNACSMSSSPLPPGVGFQGPQISIWCDAHGQLAQPVTLSFPLVVPAGRKQSVQVFARRTDRRAALCSDEPMFAPVPRRDFDLVTSTLRRGVDLVQVVMRIHHFCRIDVRAAAARTAQEVKMGIINKEDADHLFVFMFPSNDDSAANRLRTRIIRDNYRMTVADDSVHFTEIDTRVFANVPVSVKVDGSQSIRDFGVKHLNLQPLPLTNITDAHIKNTCCVVRTPVNGADFLRGQADFTVPWIENPAERKVLAPVWVDTVCNTVALILGWGGALIGPLAVALGSVVWYENVDLGYVVCSVAGMVGLCLAVVVLLQWLAQIAERQRPVDLVCRIQTNDVWHRGGNAAGW